MQDSHIRRAALSIAVAVLLTALGACKSAQAPEPAKSAAAASTPADTGERIVHADAEPGNWLSYGRDYQEQRNSPLTQINTGNVSQLGLAWSYDLDTHRGQEATPLVVDGVMYTTSAWSKVQAFDAVSGKLLWQFDPKVPGATAAKACCDVVNRGVAYWDGKVFVGTLDGRLIGIDAETGQQLWSVVTVDQSKDYTITGAPRVIKGRVIIGNGGAEFGVRGYITAYDADTGKLAWRFYTVPGKPGEKDGAASDDILAKVTDTWNGEWWKNGGGGGTVWDSMSYDPELDLLYIGVGNGSYWRRTLRSPGGGDNLFVASIVAIKPETGEYVWHYQETPGDEWDYTATNHMVLADLTIDGQPRKVLMQAPKNGFFYVLDRTNGKLISAKPYVTVNWASGIDLKTGKPNFNPDADYAKTGKTWLAMPGALGAHDWMPMAYNPGTGYVYIPMFELGFPYLTDRNFEPKKKGVNLGVDLSALNLPDDPKVKAAVKKTVKGYLIAWDPKTQKEVWRAPNPVAWNGGVLSTSGGLVFQGDGGGHFNAYDAKTGKKLWSYDVQTGVVAPPIAWSKDGKEYITLVAGWGGAFPLLTGELSWGENGPIPNRSRVLTFALGAKGSLPPPPEAVKRVLQSPKQFADAQTIATGQKAYDRTCIVCHGAGAISGGIAPDLRYSAAIGNKEFWDQVVVNGVFASQGMVSFKENFTPQEIEAIRAYVIDRAHVATQAEDDSAAAR
ncbi:PQQ-dependent dehydrogenase, methanol/ethanol family [Solimonas marina]|uniref:PQQ-dependent dehydrogenase, methanol/ethanol family n=1 Tax=Solimonas marina TaxID=2714601 RepID=A0A970B7C4_9GAMM|nr:PQQ-dependent dehydrogenase, methanol/ethanol family [Solimonas marina]NKF23510.1 PQQ-dependent dehydrogenase, methanol/ethanol family [Solimonas marina]